MESKPHLLWLMVIAALASLSWATSATNKDRPNFVFILTDDQDLHMNSLDYMPQLQKHLLGAGTLYQKFYCTISLCCPSRANLWTGRMSHNTNVTDIAPPYGGYPAFMRNGFNDAWLPIWMKAAGYSTRYVGKFLNYHNIFNYDKPFPAGWTDTDFLLEPYTYQYTNPGFQHNHDPPVNFSGRYNTDMIAEKTLAYLDDAVKEDEPFFLVSAPIAPHATVDISYTLFPNDTIEREQATIHQPVPAARHANMFPGVIVPRTPSFNPAEPNGVSWIGQLPRQNQTNVDWNDEFYRNRLRALQSVDEMIEQIVERLDSLGVLDNTYIVYTADNGYHIGQHRLQPSKQCQYQEDVNIPLIIRGPGVAANHTTGLVTSMTDLAPTFLTLAGAPLRDDFDGGPIPVHSTDIEALERENMFGEHVNIEHWGVYTPEGKYGNISQINSTYKGIRVIGGGYDLLYTVWCTGDHELYDLVADPYETQNLYSLYNPSQTPTGCGNEASQLQSTSQRNQTSYINRLVPRLDALILVGKTCKAESCRNPWGVLHPQGNVHSLNEAMEPQYDHFYEVQENKVKFVECVEGYFISNELPINVIAYQGGDRL